MKKIVALGLMGFVACILSARADIIPSFMGTSASGSNTIWSYTVNITDEQNASAGDFFTIYDFGPFVAGSATQPLGWTLTSSLLGTTPSKTNPTDDPSILNLTWTYSGATIIGASAAGKGIGPFSVTLLGTVTLQRPSEFAAQGTLAVGTNAGTKIGNVGQIPVPTAIPEPSTLALAAMASGLFMIGRKIARRRKS